MEKQQKIEDAQMDLKLDITDPTGKTLNSFNSPLTFPKDKERIRYIIKMSGFGVTVSGDYLLKLSYKQQGEVDHKLADEMSIKVQIKSGITTKTHS